MLSIKALLHESHHWKLTFNVHLKDIALILWIKWHFTAHESWIQSKASKHETHNKSFYLIYQQMSHYLRSLSMFCMWIRDWTDSQLIINAFRLKVWRGKGHLMRIRNSQQIASLLSCLFRFLHTFLWLALVCLIKARHYRWTELTFELIYHP